MLYCLKSDVLKMPLSVCGKQSRHPKKIMEQHFQDVAQKVQYDKNSDTFAAHFAHHFDQKPTPQQCHEIMKFETLSKVNPIELIKTWSKDSCTLCMKERLEIFSRS